MNRLLEKFRQLKGFYIRQSPIRKILLGGFFAFSVVFTGSLLLLILVWSGTFGHLPDKEELLSVKNPASTEVYSADSVLLGRYFVQERSDIGYDDIPSFVVDATVATEDARFYEHSGIDKKSLLRVLVKSIFLQDESSGGGSTITQQLAKNLYQRQSYFFLSLPINKIKELILASRIERVYDKKSILALYLNTVPFGDNTYGLEAAAQRFFSVHASALTPDQGAILIGMLKATYLYNPRLFPERSKVRRNVVLAQMKKYGKLAANECDSLQALPIKLLYKKISQSTGLATYFREHIRPELVEWCRTNVKQNGKPFNLYTDGLKIYTTIDSRLQGYAEEAMKAQMASIQKTFESHWAKKTPWSSSPDILTDAINRSGRYQKLSEQGMSAEEIDKVMKAPVPMNIFTWQGEKEVTMSPLDSIKYYLGFLHAGLLAIEPSSGSIRAWVGGIDYHFFQFDHVRESTKRQVGSTFKPIVYAAALEQEVKPCDFISAEKVTYTNEKDWTPQNTEENYNLKYSMEGALAYSVNTVSVKVLERAGIQNTISLAKKMGIQSELPAVPSLALGVSDVSMIEMVTAYSSFANDGLQVKPFSISHILSHDDSVLYVGIPPPHKEQIMSRETAQIMIHMLKRTINEGTGSRLRERYGITNDIAGKTGTTQSNADGWFIAMLPDLVIGCWVGADDSRIRFRTTALGQGANTALPIVANLLRNANEDPSLASVMGSQFEELPASLEYKLSCVLYKSDKTLLEKIFGKKEKENKRDFTEKKKKKGFLKKLFGG